jgi:2-polyprenyl-6-methoxyphenol hydroxylase-like FAD-dependent oxidoreductase
VRGVAIGLDEVLVVGAGPVGLTVGVELWRRGVPCRVIDRLVEPARYAKAVGVQPRTLEVWENLGVLRDALDAAIPLCGQLVYVNGEQVARIDLALPPDVPYGFVALPQYVTEWLLTHRLHQFGGRVERGVELVAFESDSDGVNARLRAADGGEQEVRVGYLVGADGAHSRVRKGLGLVFAGDAFPEQYMLGDVEVDWALPAGYVVRSSHQADGRTDEVLVCVPLPGTGRYRMSMLVPDDLATRPTQGEVQHGMGTGPVPQLHHIQAVLDRLSPEPARAHTLRWSSVFRISHRLADRYGQGRVFIAGDAAHIHPPTGAQGMNTGIQDGVNLAWKLALAVQGAAADGLLGSYQAERHPVGEEVVGRTVRHAREGFEADPDDPSTVIRREAQLLVHYRDSPLVGDGGGCLRGPLPGERARDCRGLRRAAVSHPLRLFELLAHPHHTLLLYADDIAQLPVVTELARLADALAGGRMKTYLIGAATSTQLDGSSVPLVVDGAGEFQGAYGATGGTGYLVRPDGYVGFRAASLTCAGLCRHLEGVFAAQPVPGASGSDPGQRWSTIGGSNDLGRSATHS